MTVILRACSSAELEHSLDKRGSQVQILSGPGYIPNVWGFSSAGRASALQAEGHRFDPDKLQYFLPSF